MQKLLILSQESIKDNATSLRRMEKLGLIERVGAGAWQLTALGIKKRREEEKKIGGK